MSFALRLNLHADPGRAADDALAIEQSLMPGETGKRFEYETAVAAGDALSAHFHDYDWADEVLHAQIGRRVLKREGISVDEAHDARRGDSREDVGGAGSVPSARRAAGLVAGVRPPCPRQGKRGGDPAGAEHFFRVAAHCSRSHAASRKRTASGAARNRILLPTNEMHRATMGHGAFLPMGLAIPHR